MAEYIEREAVLEQMRANIHQHYYGDGGGYYLAEDAIDTVKHEPAADVVEVRHARFKWGYQNGQYGIWCTDCGAGWTDSENAEWIAHEHDFCPKCGAKMDGSKNKKRYHVNPFYITRRKDETEDGKGGGE